MAIIKQTAVYLFIFTKLTLCCQAPDKRQTAIITPANVDSILVYEQKFRTNDSVPPPANSSWFEYKRGTKNILFIAGHATAQVREGKIKQPDGGTGSLAVELNKLTGVPVLYTTYLSPSDPNFYDTNEFKDTLAKILNTLKPVLVIDLHGSHPYRPYDVDFGTMKGKSYLSNKAFLDSLRSLFSAEGLINQSQDFFPAEKNQTITKFVYNRKIPCIQLEINSNYLSVDLGNIYGQKTAQLLQALIRFINETAK